MTAPFDLLAAPDLDSWQFTLLRQDGVLATWRAAPSPAAPTVLAVGAASAAVAREAGQLLANELALAGRLDQGWARKPLHAARHANGLVLVYADDGARTLEAEAASGLAPRRFLEVATEVAAALYGAHAHGILHRALTPAHVVSVEGEPWRLAGFTHAATAEAPGELLLPGLLDPAYLSPEHAGRKGMAPDARSDLYALGVILFQLLTGQLPFRVAQADSASAWIHAHLASEPAHADRLNPAVPPLLASLVAKLLAKAPADRYQSAAALLADLRRCAGAWAAGGAIAPFALARTERAARAVLPSRLYGREALLAQLAADFGRVRSERTFGVSVVHGPSGIGKSALLARFLADPCLRHATLISAQADQYGGDAPYAALVDGMRSLVADLLGQSEASVAHWRGRIGAAIVDPEPTLALVPELALLLDGAALPPAQPAPDGGGRVAAAVLRLLRAFASAEQPLVIVVDNAHWLDPAAAGLLEQVVGMAAELPVMLVVGTRSRAADGTAGLGGRLARRAAYYRELAVEPLSVAQLGQMLADTFEGAQPLLERLAGLVHHKTGGHPYFVRQFLHALADSGLARYGESGWQFDFDGIWRRPFTDNMLGLALQGLIQLPQELHGLLGTVAALGRAADLALLCEVAGLEAGDLDARLAPALRAEVLARRGETYVFTHDRLQEAAYDMLEPARRARVHHAAALALLARGGRDGQERSLFHAVDHLAHAPGLVPAAQAADFAALAARAGKLARRACAYAAACGYQLQARDLLARAPGDRQDAALARDIELELAHCRFLTGELDACAALVRGLLAAQPDRFVLAQVQCLAVELAVRRGRYREASGIALDALRDFGIHIPAEPGEQACDDAYAALRGRIGGLHALAPLADREARSVLALLASLLVPAAFTSSRLLFLQLCHMLDLTLRHGMTPQSAVSLAWLGVMVCERYRAFGDGFAYAQAARELVGRHGYASHEAQVLIALDQASVWTQPLEYALDCAQAGFEAARAQGDFTIACFEACHRTCILLARGDRLETLREEIERALAFVAQVGFADVEAILQVQRAAVDHLRTVAPAGRARPALLGRHEQPGSGGAESMSTLRFWRWLYIGMLDYLEGDHAGAVACLEQAGLLAWSAPAHLHQADYHLFSILALCRAAETAGGTRARLDAHLAQLASWGSGYPEGFADRLALARAAVLEYEGDPLAALAEYERAAALAAKRGGAHLEAIAQECAARLAAQGGLATAAAAHAAAACAAYRRWGALAKVAWVEHAYPGAAGGAAAGLAPLAATAAIRDIDGVIRATRALSEEIHLAPLVQALLSIALEHASAQRAVLLRRDGDRLLVQASARLGAEGVEVDMTETAPDELDLPLTVVHTALRSRAPVSVSDSQRPAGHALDPYLSAYPRCAAIAIPMMKRAQLVGMLYLENRLSSYGFTGEHIQLLSLLAAQAAVSLENAHLYAELLQENRERRHAERALRESRATLLLGERINQSGSWTWEVERGVVNCSAECRRIFGLDPGMEWIGLDALMARIHPGDRAGIARLLGEASATRAPFRFEHRIAAATGEVRHLSVIGQPMAEGDADTDTYVGTVSDVTRRKAEEAYLHRAKEDLVRGARLTTVGQLTAAIAHEVNQPLMSISSSAGAGLRWLQRDTPAPGKLRALLQDIVGQSQRAGKIIQTLQSLAHRSPEFRPVDLHALIREALALARGELDRHEIRVLLDLAAQPSSVDVDAVQLQQVLVNLLGNAIEAMAASSGRDRVLQVATVGVGHGIEVQVSDNGVGGDEAVLEAMFEPFVSTKPGAIGMGLAVCRSIIEAHGGNIRAQARAPHGCHLAFVLPQRAGLKGDTP